MIYTQEQYDVVYDLPVFQYEQNKITNFNKIPKIVSYLRENIRVRKTINRNHSSYTLKHIIENDIGYITNGEFIMAALIAGYQMSNVNRMNPCFNMDNRDIDFIATKEERMKKELAIKNEDKDFHNWYNSMHCR